MPALKKKALSLYLRTGCPRQLALNLYSDRERSALGMPARQQARPGLGLSGRIGYEWQDEKINELGEIFGNTAVHVNSRKSGNRPQTLPLAEALPQLAAHQFIVEGAYDAESTTFLDAVGISTIRDRYGQPLGTGDAIPDLIQALPPAATPLAWERTPPDGAPVATMLGVLPSGDVAPLDANDERLRLRVIDIKLSAEPGAHYYAEVVYYSITLAAWLVEHKFDDRFVVIAAPAVWPGSYDASQIRRLHNQCQKEGREPEAEELAVALEVDIEIAPFDVFASRLRRFFQEELPRVLQTKWDELPWHVSYMCKGCDFLGYPWRDRDGKLTNSSMHCWPMAEDRRHLSRVAGLPRGSAKLLSATVADVPQLAALTPQAEEFERSPSLRAKRTLFPHRAKALEAGFTGIIPESGGDALMPRWPDLHIYMFIEYDLSSAITATFSLRAFWKEPLPYRTDVQPKTRRWAARVRGETTDFPDFQEVYLVDQRDLSRERDELLKFLRALRDIMRWAERQDEHDAEAGRRGDPEQPKKLTRSTYQIYLWDEAQRKQLTRVIGRHLDAILADNEIRDLAWLFPPPELLTHAEEASYKSPFTFVAPIVHNTIAAPVAHHYTLLDVVQTYHPASLSSMTVHPLYQEPLSDLIPGERLHEMWTRRGNYTQTQRLIEETTTRKLQALEYVVSCLEKDLKSVLVRAAAPPLVRNIDRLKGVPPQSVLWHEFHRLNQAMSELEEHSLRAMPAHEREARFKSARLLKRLENENAMEAHARLQSMTPKTLAPPSELFIYELNPDSYDFNVRPPALGYALAPRQDPTFLGQSAYSLISSYSDIKVAGRLAGSVAEAGLTKVSVVAIDRVHGLIALRPWHTNCMLKLEQYGVADFCHDVMLDPVSEDYLSRKLLLTLQGIGRPASAGDDRGAVHALGLANLTTDSPTPETPAAEFLWQAPALAATEIARDVAGLRSRLDACGEQLNDSQWEALRAALTRRLALIWGPPGTGKSQTLRAIIGAAVWHAHKTNVPLRLLISANTYAAIDNVLLGVDTLLSKIMTGNPYCVIRLASDYNDPPAELKARVSIKKIAVKTTLASADTLDLQALLDKPNGIVVVAGPPQQLHNLAIATKAKSKNETPKRTQRRWFDLIVIDEASQLGVAETTLVVSKAAANAAFIMAGDDKQLPPIQPATPPEGLENVVGSLYNYVRHQPDIAPSPLQVNYRSCQTLVNFTRHAGYDLGLHAFHPDLRLTLLQRGFPTERPADWPDHLVWTKNWAKFLDPQYPAVCFIYEDDVAGQSNAFEADAVASLVWLLYGRIDQQLTGERDGGGFRRPTGQPHGAKQFWENAVGVVTPHRAQMSKIVGRLQSLFNDHDPAAIWQAVDTVERFQGQQRDVILASFGLGDPDLIRSEDEFLYNLNRFNVMASRARAKLIVFATRSLIDHLSDDGDILEDSRLLKHYAETFCELATPITLGVLENGTVIPRPGVLRRCRAPGGPK